MKLKVLAAAAIAALFAAGCGSVGNGLGAERQVSQHHVMGNIWERTELVPWLDDPMHVLEDVADHATAFCRAKGLGMQPLDQSMMRGRKDASGKLVQGASVTLRYRCVESGSFKE